MLSLSRARRDADHNSIRAMMCRVYWSNGNATGTTPLLTMYARREVRHFCNTWKRTYHRRPTRGINHQHARQ
jgi:hypothetical protein